MDGHNRIGIESKFFLSFLFTEDEEGAEGGGGRGGGGNKVTEGFTGGWVVEGRET